MLAATIVTIVSVPVYYSLYHAMGATGLAIASDLGIALQTIVLALLLHQRRMVSLSSLDYAELGRCLLAAASGGAAVWGLVATVSQLLTYPVALQLHTYTHWIDFAILLTGGALWCLVARWVLEKTGSALPSVVMKRLGLTGRSTV
jgi:putative peptidoglycan lipid II flippase